MKKERTLREGAVLIAMPALLFLALALLAAFLIAGESRRARIQVEYEADRTAAAILDSFRSQGEIDPALLDPRVLGFALYRANGGLVAGFGDAPAFIRPFEKMPPFRYDDSRRSLALTRPIGVGPMLRMGRKGRTPGGLFYLSMDIGAYYRSRFLYTAATILVPLTVAGLAAAFLSLSLSNLRFRRRASEQETLARLGESARTLAHEIRNPLGAIRLQTGLLRKRLGGEAHREIEVIEEETERLNALTRRVGDFLRNPRGESESIDLADFLKDLAPRLPYAVVLDADLQGAQVSFDRELLRSVIENLARNAHESYGESGGEVEVSLSREGGRVILAVLDRGAGVAPELRGKVFDPFYTSKTQGSGIGLPLARRFVEAAKGTLTLEPRPGGGSVARIELPAGGPE